jgi:hypothetical protein
MHVHSERTGALNGDCIAGQFGDRGTAGCSAPVRPPFNQAITAI